MPFDFYSQNRLTSDQFEIERFGEKGALIPALVSTCKKVKVQHFWMKLNVTSVDRIPFTPRIYFKLQGLTNYINLLNMYFCYHRISKLFEIEFEQHFTHNHTSVLYSYSRIYNSNTCVLQMSKEENNNQ